MQRPARRHNPSSIASDHGIHPVVVDIAIENFNPWSGVRESNCVVVPGYLGQRCNDDYVVPRTLKPPMKCDDAVLVVYMERIHIVTA